MSADEPVHFIGSGEYPLDALAQFVITRERKRLPDLSDVAVLIPDTGLAAPLRERLLQHAREVGIRALVPPFTGTLDQWRGHSSVEPPPSSLRRTLALLNLVVPVFAVRLPSLAPTEYLSVADELRSIFDDWEQAPPESLRDLIKVLARNYGVSDELAPMTNEARLVYECWHRWQPYLKTRQGAALRRPRLMAAAQPVGHERVYLCGFQEWSTEEASWFSLMLATGRAVFVAHAPPCYVHELPACAQTAAEQTEDKLDPADRVIRAAFRQGPIEARLAEARSAARDSPLLAPIQWFEAAGFEEEAQTAASHAVRFLSEGASSVGIVTADRKLARRVRALLEHYGVSPADSAGWRLSTTSAAQALHIWWHTCASGLDEDALAQLARSPFFQNDVRHNPPALPPAAEARIKRAAAPLVKLLAQGTAYPIGTLLATLLTSVEQCGLAESLERDDAGKILFRDLSGLVEDTRGSRLALTAPECFAWLTEEFEARRFSVTRAQASVRLLGLAESRMYRFDAVILTGADEHHLPGAPASPIFFNDAARHELGLASSDREHDVLRLDFLRLLRAAPRVLVGWRRQDGDSVRAQSPWFERLRLFHLLAYGLDLWAADPVSIEALPAPPALKRRPRPTVPPALVPREMSARAHQRLLDCPYQYFAAEVLHLRRRPEATEDRSYADYGEHVHRVLEAFHRDVPGLPGPFLGPVTPHNRGAAADLLDAISVAVFDPDGDFARRLALNRWRGITGAYLEWEIEHGRLFRNQSAEQVLRRVLDPAAPLLYGRVDRIDARGGSLALIDYKTGRPPTLGDILSGEQTQLAFYALLLGGTVESACLLCLKDGVKPLSVDEPALTEITTRTAERLLELHRQMLAGVALLAQGDEETCAVCDYEGLCRRSFWAEDTDPAA
ncbi:MAG: PD-(D/E)XK nuclease family protein [Acidiferrobacteraceae bacterium]